VQYSKEMNSKSKEIEELLASKERYDKLYEEDKKNYKKEISRLESEVITKL
jgi:hypothetical protein